MIQLLLIGCWIIGIATFSFTIYKMKKVIKDFQERLKNSHNESDSAIYRTYISKYKVTIRVMYGAMAFITLAVLVLPALLRNIL